jgi:hypothetical protein
MQYLIEVNPDQDLQFLLKLFEKLQIRYQPHEPIIKNEAKKSKNGEPRTQIVGEISIADKYMGKMSSELADALLVHIEQSRNEWDRDI